MLKMITLKQRTQQALEAGFTNSQLAAAAGVSSGAVSQWLTTTQNLKAESVIGLVKLTGWRHEWWAQGKGPREDAAGSESELAASKYTSETTTYKAVISFDSSNPEAPLLMRLLSAAESPGIKVEIRTWKGPRQSVSAVNSAPPRERRMGHLGPAAEVAPTRSARSSKKGSS
jgi:transcriptional regulator with XRE-family HTH domain